MPRLPFDPDLAPGAPSEPPERGHRAELGPSHRDRKPLGSLGDLQQLTVTQATELIKTTLEQRVPSPIRIVGEVSNLSAKNHWYFSLKDENSILCCVAFATAVRRFGFTPKDGDEVLATGHVSHYGAQGRTQMYVSELAPVGAGALEMRFRAMCEELRALGYFDELRKKPLPVFPRRIAVITSATGAAIQDVINTAAHRCKAVGLLLVDVRVQGEGAAAEVARAIRWVDHNRKRLGIDAILVTRGGGSIEDLWAFNERVVAEAVFNCHLPVVAAIGHESDITIIELVADVRASTPSQAAMRLVPSSQELCRQIEHLAHRIGALVRRTVERQRQEVQRITGDSRRILHSRLLAERAQVARLGANLAQLHPRALLAQRHSRLSVQSQRLQRAMAHLHSHRKSSIGIQATVLSRAAVRLLRYQRERVRGLERQLVSMDPHGVLRRGYSLTLHKDGSVVRSAGEVKLGQSIISRLADGSIESVVGAARSQSSGKRAGRTRNGADSADQLNLFAAAP